MVSGGELVELDVKEVRERTRLEDVGDSPADAVILGVVRQDVFDHEHGLRGPGSGRVSKAKRK